MKVENQMNKWLKEPVSSGCELEQNSSESEQFEVLGRDYDV